jgi:predicted transcriptional regulator
MRIMRIKRNEHGRFINSDEKLSIIRYIYSTNYNLTFKAICVAIVGAYNTTTRQCNPSASEIAYRLNISSSTVKKYLKPIQKSGFIILVSRGNKGRSNVYELNRELIELGNNLPKRVQNDTSEEEIEITHSIDKDTSEVAIEIPTSINIDTSDIPVEEPEYSKEDRNQYSNKDCNEYDKETNDYVDLETFRRIVMNNKLN